MKIKFNDKYGIASDISGYAVHQIHIAKSGERKGEEIWQPVTFHGSFDRAYVSLAERRVRLMDADNLTDAIKAATAIGDEMRTILEKANMA